MRVLLCILLCLYIPTYTMGQSPLDTVRKRLCNLVEYNIDILYKNDSAVVMGWLIAMENNDGGTQYKVVCQDTSIEQNFGWYSKYVVDLPWSRLSKNAEQRTTIIQPFIIGGIKSGYLIDTRDSQGEAILKDWLIGIPKAEPILLKPFPVTVTVISCSLAGPYSVSPIPKSAIPKLTAPIIKNNKLEKQ